MLRLAFSCCRQPPSANLCKGEGRGQAGRRGGCGVLGARRGRDRERDRHASHAGRSAPQQGPRTSMACTKSPGGEPPPLCPATPTCLCAEKGGLLRVCGWRAARASGGDGGRRRLPMPQSMRAELPSAGQDRHMRARGLADKEVGLKGRLRYGREIEPHQARCDAPGACTGEERVGAAQNKGGRTVRRRPAGHDTGGTWPALRGGAPAPGSHRSGGWGRHGPPVLSAHRRRAATDGGPARWR